tara:strand:- start:1763 stop:2503 length:741 start_codon:yes stop_codon:yes gene_type:complete
MSATPIHATRDEAKSDSRVFLVLAVVFWVSVAVGCLAALKQFATFTGSPDLPDHRWIVPWALIAVVPAIVRVFVCPSEQLGPIALTWAVVASGLIFMMDQGGLTVFGAMAGWWWWHYAIGGGMAAAPALLAIFRDRGSVPRSPFVAIAVIGLLFAGMLAVTGASPSDEFAHLTRDVHIGMTPDELAEALHEIPAHEFHYHDPSRVMDRMTVAATSDWSGSVEVWVGIQASFDFEGGKLSQLIVNFD